MTTVLSRARTVVMGRTPTAAQNPDCFIVGDADTVRGSPSVQAGPAGRQPRKVGALAKRFLPGPLNDVLPDFLDASPWRLR